MIYIRLFEDRDKYDNSTLYYPSVSCIKNENSKIMYDVFKSNTPTIIAKYVLVEDVPQGESAFYTNSVYLDCGYSENYVRSFDSFKVNGVETVISEPIEELGTYTPIATEIDENMGGPLFSPESLITGASALHITFSKKPELIGLYIDGMGNIVGDFDMWADVAALTVISDTEYLMNISTVSGLLDVDYKSLIITAYGSDGSMTIDDINSFNTSIKATSGGVIDNGNNKGWSAGEYEVVMVPSKTCNLDALFKDVYSLNELYLYGDFSNFHLNSFASMSNILKIKFHKFTIKSIAQEMFMSCNLLQNINIPSSVTSIGDYAFSSCSGLTSVTIGNGVTSIGNSAFYECQSLTSVIIPVSVTSIGYGAFSECDGLTSITIPNSVTSIGDGAFYNCLFQRDKFINNSNLTSSDNWGVKLYDIIQNDGLAISGTTASDCRTNATSVVIPDSVTSIGDSAFYECQSLTSVIIPGSVTSIGEFAFFDCQSLTSVIIPGSVTSIGASAFSGCTNLDSIVIPDSVTTIGERAFGNCYALTSVTIPDSVTTIGKYAFKYCRGLTSVAIGNGVTSIGDSAFGYCGGLTSVTIPDSVTSIGNGAFSGCDSLTSIVIPDSVTNIGGSAFRYCSGLTSIVIPDGVTSIGDYTFSGCDSLTSIVIPDGVTSIGYGAFSGCDSLTSIVIPDSVTNIGDDAFWNCNSLNSVTIPDSITRIGNSVFERCYGLTSVTIPDSVTSIGYGAFSGCYGLTSVTIPDSITSIGNEAFRYCSGLSEIICLSTTAPSLGSYSFNGLPSNGVLKVPNGSNYSTWLSKLPSGWTIQYI